MMKMLSPGSATLRRSLLGPPLHTPLDTLLHTLLLALLLSVAAPALAGSVVFAPSSQIATDFRPGGIVAGDFNNDARQDMLVLNFTTVSMVLGNGDGTFRTPVNYPVNVNASLGVAIDLNDDGNLDAVIGNFAGSNLVVLIGRGDGTFDAPKSYATGLHPLGIGAGRFNVAMPGLGIAVVNNGSNNVSILQGDDEGVFGSATNIAVGREPRGMALADLNSDGRDDIVVANFADNNVSVLFGIGDGTFQPAVNYAVGAGPHGIGVADVNGDGRADIVTANNTAGTVSVLLGKADGTFNAHVAYAVGPAPRFVVLEDFDGDGEIDIAVTSNGSSSLAVRKGKGDGTFGAAITFGTGSTPNDLRAIDVDGDGKMDLVAANFGSGSVSVLLNRSVLPSGEVVEFYNTNLDNYFITADPNEQMAVASGAAGPGWAATGNTFNAGGPLKVCRFYGSITPGPNSHFYTIDAQECQALKTLQATTPDTQKRWNFESNDFSSSMSANQQCAGDLIPVYRAYNNGAARGIDSNHRITSNKASYDAQIAKGWSGEGVVMCTPAS